MVPANRGIPAIAGLPADGAYGRESARVQNLGDALAQPLRCMDAVQQLRLPLNKPVRQKSTPQQTVTSVPKSSASTAVTTTTTTSAKRSDTVDRHQNSEPANPQVVRAEL